MAATMLFVGKLQDGDTNLTPMTFTHPKYQRDCYYLVGERHIYEMQTFHDDEHCSLFVDDYVFERDDIYLINRIDPIYLLIPSLLKNRKHSISNANKFCLSPLDQLLSDKEMQHIAHKLPSKKSELELICDFQRIDEDAFYVLNDEKVVEFLDLKLARIQSTLQSSSMSTNNTLNEALCILNEYIAEPYFAKLCEKHGLSAKRVLEPRKRKQPDQDMQHEQEGKDNAEDDEAAPNKKRKMNENEYSALNEDLNRMNMTQHTNTNTGTATKTIKATSKSRAISQLEKVNTKGMRSMMSYFSKKKNT
eukprot:CAMPEP_0197036482 /NCGR_PEP_ID=MMETSP1384-20130603/13972_1 /TAXON_ID=29189 /ORGANISM="Ammonia sp." /LENGTH=304 /DNA_ID=CAMNT_0042466665 /DNA_START=38 /DNA_END=952 /DNA_ORIENTATION=-